MKYSENITDLIGGTPLIKIKNNENNNENLILGKCEFLNPTHSVKDRIAKSMILESLKQNIINYDTTLIEPTSGNTGIALASISASLGIKIILVMPESMSVERREILKFLGAELVLTEPAKGMKGAIDKANELNEEIENSHILNQFVNTLNPKGHRENTAQEIIRDTEGKVDILVAGIGTGGSITGIGEELKKINPDIKIVAVEPKDSPVLSGGKPGPHKIQGIGAGFKPYILNTDIFDEIIQVSNEEAIECSKELGKKDGLFVGISSGSNIFVSKLVSSREENKNKVIVTILCDTAERYLSTDLFKDL